MAVANHALSCCHHGSLIHAPETPTTSKGTFLHRTGLLALPRRNRRPSRIHAVSKPNTHATLLESTTGINMDGIVAEAPSLLALSSDLDWQRSVWELRREARRGALGAREMALERLGGEFQGWMHDAMFESILRSDGGAQHVQEEVGVRIRVEELRWQAALQAAEELARGVDSSFDWECEAAEMRQSIVKQERDGVEQQLLKSWESARHDMDMDAAVLHDEALQSHLQNDSYLTLFSDAMKETKKPIEHSLEKSVSWWTLGVTMATGWFGSQAMDAIAAAEDSATSAAASAAAAAARTAPEWVAPTVLATPVVSYLLFTWYRNTVNPNAKLTDWVFGLIAMAIVGNIVLIATIGVRLY